MKQVLCFVISVICIVCITAPGDIIAAANPPAPNVVLQGLETDGSGVFKNRSVVQGQYLQFDITFAAVNGTPITIDFIQLVTSTDISIFPFDVLNSSYFQKGDRYKFNMRCRGDAAANTYYNIPFSVTYIVGNEPPDEQIVIVSVLVLSSSQGEKPEEDNPPSGFPKITIPFSRTLPDPVVAGDQFELTVTIKNNGRMTASNMKCTYATGTEFTPITGASSFYINQIGGGSSVSQKIQLKASSTVAPGSYPITFSFSYDVSGGKEPVSDTEVVSIPLIQIPRIQIEAPRIEPLEISAGDEINVMSSVSNVGKTVLYNCSVTFRDVPGVMTGLTRYLGNIEPGATKQIDEYLQTVGEGDARLLMDISFEDGDGQVYTESREITFTVFAYNKIVDPFDPWQPDEEQPRGVSPLVLAIIVILLVAGAVAALLILRKRNKSKKEREFNKRLALETQQSVSGQTDADNPLQGGR